MTKLNAEGRHAKRRNHTVPRSLLCQWGEVHSAIRTIHFLDCNDGLVKSESGEKAGFAISEYQYVPIGTNGFRDESMENWFSPDESALIDLARETTAKTFGKSMTPVQQGKAIRACILLGYRSHYEFVKMTNLATLENPSAGEEAIQRMVVAHFWSVYKRKLEQFKNWEFTIFHSLPEKLLICDRPLYDGTVHMDPVSMICIPISPTAFLLGVPAENPTPYASLSWKNGSTSTLAKFMNHQSAMRAREFLVGEPAQLSALANEMGMADLQKRKSIDKFFMA